jgi:hypothetical protein
MGTLWNRLENLGWSVEKTLETPTKKGKQYTAFGKTASITYWKDKTTLSVSGLKWRLGRGDSLEDILEETWVN